MTDENATSDRYQDAIDVLEREIRERDHPQADALRLARRVLLSERGDADAPPVRPVTNPNAVPLANVIDVYLKHPGLGPEQPFQAWEARRHAVEQVRRDDVPQVVA